MCGNCQEFNTNKNRIESDWSPRQKTDTHSCTHSHLGPAGSGQSTSVTNEEHVKLLTDSIQCLSSNPRPWSYESLIIPAYTDYCNQYTKNQFCFLTREGFFPPFSILLFQIPRTIFPESVEIVYFCFFPKYHVYFSGKWRNGQSSVWTQSFTALIFHNNWDYK